VTRTIRKVTDHLVVLAGCWHVQLRADEKRPPQVGHERHCTQCAVRGVKSPAQKQRETRERRRARGQFSECGHPNPTSRPGVRCFACRVVHAEKTLKRKQAA
jgi:hypothetical protein